MNTKMATVEEMVQTLATSSRKLAQMYVIRNNQNIKVSIRSQKMIADSKVFIVIYFFAEQVIKQICISCRLARLTNNALPRLKPDGLRQALSIETLGHVQSRASSRKAVVSFGSGRSYLPRLG